MAPVTRRTSQDSDTEPENAATALPRHEAVGTKLQQLPVMLQPLEQIPFWNLIQNWKASSTG